MKATADYKVASESTNEAEEKDLRGRHDIHLVPELVICVYCWCYYNKFSSKFSLEFYYNKFLVFFGCYYNKGDL
jgi:hypothetical protein